MGEAWPVPIPVRPGMMSVASGRPVPGKRSSAGLKFSAVPAPGQDLAAFDRHSLSEQLETEVSGFIGFDILRRMKVRIDYHHGKVEFEPTSR